MKKQQQQQKQKLNCSLSGKALLFITFVVLYLVFLDDTKKLNHSKKKNCYNFLFRSLTHLLAYIHLKRKNLNYFCCHLF